MELVSWAICEEKRASWVSAHRRSGSGRLRGQLSKTHVLVDCHNLGAVGEGAVSERLGVEVLALVITYDGAKSNPSVSGLYFES